MKKPPQSLIDLLDPARVQAYEVQRLMGHPDDLGAIDSDSRASVRAMRFANIAAVEGTNQIIAEDGLDALEATLVMIDALGTAAACLMVQLQDSPKGTKAVKRLARDTFLEGYDRVAMEAMNDDND